MRFCCVAEEVSAHSVPWDRGGVNDGDTDCPTSLVAEGSRLWKRRFQKESQAWLMLCWRNEAPKEKWGHEQSWWWISGGKAGEPLHYSKFYLSWTQISDMVYMSPDDLTDLCSEGLPGFLFCKSSCLREMTTCFCKDYYWNTFPASQSLLYLL